VLAARAACSAAIEGTDDRLVVIGFFFIFFARLARLPLKAPTIALLSLVFFLFFFARLARLPLKAPTIAVSSLVSHTLATHVCL